MVWLIRWLRKGNNILLTFYLLNMFSLDDTKRIGDQLNIDWNVIDINQFHMGLNVELEHGTKYPNTNITNNDPVLTGKIALAHLNEVKDYYTKLKTVEGEED